MASYKTRDISSGLLFLVETGDELVYDDVMSSSWRAHVIKRAAKSGSVFDSNDLLFICLAIWGKGVSFETLVVVSNRHTEIR